MPVVAWRTSYCGGLLQLASSMSTSELTEALQPPSSKRCKCGADITGLSTYHINKHCEGRKHQLAMTPCSRPISTYFHPAPAAGTCTTSSTIESPDTCSSSSNKCTDDSEVVDNGYCDPSHGLVLAVMVGRLVHTPACRRSSVCHLNRCGALILLFHWSAEYAYSLASSLQRLSSSCTHSISTELSIPAPCFPAPPIYIHTVCTPNYILCILQWTTPHMHVMPQ